VRPPPPPPPPAHTHVPRRRSRNEAGVVPRSCSRGIGGPRPSSLSSVPPRVALRPAIDVVLGARHGRASDGPEGSVTPKVDRRKVRPPELTSCSGRESSLLLFAPVSSLSRRTSRDLRAESSFFGRGFSDGVIVPYPFTRHEVQEEIFAVEVAVAPAMARHDPLDLCALAAPPRGRGSGPLCEVVVPRNFVRVKLACALGSAPLPRGNASPPPESDLTV